jgi:hypothetical protein
VLASLASRPLTADVRGRKMQKQVAQPLPKREGHFVFESGHHGQVWLDLELLLMRPERVQRWQTPSRTAFVVVRLRHSEVARTLDVARRGHLHMWFQELWEYWRSTLEKNNNLPSFIEAEDVRVRTLTSEYLSSLPDVAELLSRVVD